MRRSLSAAAVVAGLVGAAPAGALADTVAWTDAGANVPGSVSLKAVAAYQSATVAGDLVIAVGQDTVSRQAVIYRYAGGTWYEDSISGVPKDSCLVSVAVDQTTAWAVGSQGGGCPGDTGGSPSALLVHFAATDNNGNSDAGDALAGDAAAETWTPVAASPIAALPGSTLPPAKGVALNGTGGYLADGSNGLYSFTDGASPQLSPVPLAPTPSSVNAVALDGSQTGYAVGDLPNGPDDFYTLSSANGNDSGTAAPFAPPQPDALAGVAALGSTAIAIDGAGIQPSWWKPDGNGTWQHYSDNSLNDVTLKGVAVGPAPSPAEPIVGADANGHGTVWRVDETPMSPQVVSCTALNGVAVLGSTDMWAVGEGGTILHYASSAARSAGCASTTLTSVGAQGASTGSNRSGGSVSGSHGGSGSTQGTGSSAAPAGSPSGSGPVSTTEVPVPQPGSGKPSPSPTHKPTPPPKHRRPMLVHDVRVRVEPGRLVVSCRLSAPARVSAVALRAGHVVGRTRWRRMRRGDCHLVIPYTGARPPAVLRILAAPLSHPSNHQAP